MAFDGTVLKAVISELSTKLVSGRITKIYQPYKTELMFTIRAHGGNHQLLISANPSFARIHLTKEKLENPTSPPMFCMLLRKHLEGAIIESIEQLELERIITFTFKGRNEIGDLTVKQLKVEIMGRHSNIILLDEREQILDSIKHLPPSVNSYRTILPGQMYKLPPTQNKLNPLTVDYATFLDKVDRENTMELPKQMVEQFSGLSPQITKEITSRADNTDIRSVGKTFVEVMDQFRNDDYRPQITKTMNKQYFSVIELTHLQGERIVYDSVSDMLFDYFYGKAERDRVHQQANDLEQFMKNVYEKNKNKIKKLKNTLAQANDCDQYKKTGELLTAHLYQMKKGDHQVEVIDFYDEEGKTVKIKLDPQKSPSANAQSYFKKYNKAKNSISIVTEQIEKTEQEIQYFELLLQQMESASPKDIAEIREELIEGGYIRNRQKKKLKKKKNEVPQLERYTSTTGTEILVGKNNIQNEYLTNRLARRDETWLHTKDIPGSHVVIRSIDYDEETLRQAATIAAYYSKAKLSSSVPVDYTLIRHVKKPSGSKPGYVIYDNQTTVYVTPDESLVRKLKN
ncbi:MAG: NFACT family protein [Bacillaceae bacterium]|nr:NFACT family protein [Bacillaceae bacterium]